jgi:hypothetical protein
MCQTTTSVMIRTGPRWGRLYAVLPVAISAFVLVEAYVPATVIRAALEYTIVGAAWVALVGWVRLNRVALDQVEWCACASQTIRIRIVPSRPPKPSPSWTAEPVLAGSPYHDGPGRRHDRAPLQEAAATSCTVQVCRSLSD